jgi:uroporphyrinogen decarboxylase
MKKSRFGRYIMEKTYRVPMPIGAFGGSAITGAAIREVVTDSTSQSEAILALHERFQTDVMMTAMDLSVEAEMFGAEIRMQDDEIPTVIDRLVKSVEDIEELPVPSVGGSRSAVYLGTVEKLARAAFDIPVFGGMIGPFSLASRLMGVSQALEATMTNPAMLQLLLKKATQFLTDYLIAFRKTGAWGVIIAEPAAGLLSPRGMREFSSVFLKSIIEQTQTEKFSIIYHNCAARINHLPTILETGAEICHFGEPMDMALALSRVDNEVILAGNLDPAKVFFSGTVSEVRDRTIALLNETAEYKNFIISSGCDIPPHTPMENLDAFFQTVRNFPAEASVDPKND